MWCIPSLARSYLHVDLTTHGQCAMSDAVLGLVLLLAQP